MDTPRKYTRRTYTHNVVFTVQGVEYHGFSEDISVGGMFIRTNRSFPVGEEIVLKFQLKKNIEKETTLHAKIVRVTHDGIGVRFMK